MICLDKFGIGIDKPIWVDRFQGLFTNNKRLVEYTDKYMFWRSISDFRRRSNKQAEIYRPGQEPARLEAPMEIDCGEVMPGFVLSLSRIW
jgi:hypothetical protein